MSCTCHSPKCGITDLHEDSDVPGVTVRRLVLRLLVKLPLIKKPSPDVVPEMIGGVNPGVIQINGKILINLEEARISQQEF